jgi:hypothetical protein
MKHRFSDPILHSLRSRDFVRLCNAPELGSACATLQEMTAKVRRLADGTPESEPRVLSAMEEILLPAAAQVMRRFGTTRRIGRDHYELYHAAEVAGERADPALAPVWVAHTLQQEAAMMPPAPSLSNAVLRLENLADGLQQHDRAEEVLVGLKDYAATVWQQVAAAHGVNRADAAVHNGPLELLRGR